MIPYVFPAAPQVTLPVRGSAALFPVRRIYCIGRNYADHAVEMGHDPSREPPFFFQKNPQNIDLTGLFPYPPESGEVHHEIELVVALKSGGGTIPQVAALDHVFGYGIGLDMTRRDLQAAAKQAGRPWEPAKAFEHSAPMTPLVPVADCGRLDRGAITLQVNGAQKQSGDLAQMIWNVPEMITWLSRFYDLAADDLIMTGTPAGVGPVQVGDVMLGRIDGLGALTVTVV